jgi:hypothetical protein
MENFRKKNKTEILEIKSPFSQTKNTVEAHSIRLHQNKGKTESQNSKIKIEIKEKNRRNLSQTTQQL